MQGQCAALSVQWQPRPVITLWDLGREGCRRADTVAGDGARGAQNARAAFADFEAMQALITTQDHRLELWDLRKLGAPAATSEPGVVADPSGALNARRLGKCRGRALCSGRAGVINIVDVSGAGGELPIAQTLYGHVSNLQWAAVDWDFAEKKENGSMGPLARAATLSTDGQALFWDVLLRGADGDSDSDPNFVEAENSQTLSQTLRPQGDAGGPRTTLPSADAARGTLKAGSAAAGSPEGSACGSKEPTDGAKAAASAPNIVFARTATERNETAPTVPSAADASPATDGETQGRRSSLEPEAAQAQRRRSSHEQEAKAEGRSSVGSRGIPSARNSIESPTAARSPRGSTGRSGSPRGSIGGSRSGSKRSSGAASGSVRNSLIRGSSGQAQDVNMKELPKGARPTALSCVFEDATKQPCICVGSKDGTLRFFQWNTAMVDGRNELMEASGGALPGHSDQVTAVCADSGLGIAVSASLDRTLRVWGKSIESSGPDMVTHSICRGHEGSVRVLSADLHRGRMASGSMDETVRIWSIQANPVAFGSAPEPGECLGTLALPEGRGSPQELLACFASGQAAAVSRSGDMLLWDLERMQRVAHVGGHRDAVFAVQLKGPDGVSNCSAALLSRAATPLCHGRGSTAAASKRSAAAEERDPNGLVARRLPTAAWTRGPGWSKWSG